MFSIFKIVIHSRIVVFAYFYTCEQEINHIIWTKYKLFCIKMYEYKMNKFTNVHLKVEYSMYIFHKMRSGVDIRIIHSTVWRALPLTFC